MDALINEVGVTAKDGDGHTYRVRAMGRQRRDGTWIGWLEFSPVGSGGLVRRTPRETTQPSREALLYWARGLNEVYLEGALRRTAVLSRR